MKKKKIMSLMMAVAMLASVIVIPGNVAWAKESGNAMKMGQNDLGMGEVINEAAETAVSKANQIKVETLGAELFPQYVEKNGSMATRSYSNACGEIGLGEIIYSETKAVSEDEELTYVEYASGRAALLYQKSWLNTSTSTAVSGGTQYRRTLVVTVSGCVGSVSVSKFAYTINPNSPDWIDNVGQCVDSSGTAVIQPHSMAESGAGAPARVTYAGNVEDTLFHYPVGISFEVRVGGNAARVYADGKEI